MKKNSALTKRWLAISLGALMVSGVSTTHAAMLFDGDNNTFATAQAASAGDILVGSIGDISAPSNDVDIWQFSLTAGANFGASISYTGLYNPQDANPVMTLFWDNGGSYYPVASTDPDAFGASFNFTPWADGNYFLAITADFNQGVDAFGNFSSDSAFQSTQDILGTSWAAFAGGSFTSFDYTVSTVPVPAAAWLFGSGLLGLAGIARRRDRSKV